MSDVHFKLDDTLRRHKKNAAALIEASGLAKATVYNIVNNKAKAVELETLSKLLNGLRVLTGEETTINDILERKTQHNWREDILKNAKPFDWDAVVTELPELTEKEKAEGEDFIQFLEEQRKRDRSLSAARQKKLLALFEETPTP